MNGKHSFVNAEVNKKKMRTQVAIEGGEQPCWNSSLRFPVKSMGDFLKITFHESDKKGRSIGVIGEADIPIYSLCRQGGI